MFALTPYFLRRHWKKLTFFLAAVFALSLYVLFVVQGALPVTTDIMRTIDGLEVREAVTGMKIYEDPSAFTSTGLLQSFVAFMAIWIMWKERRFLVTLSMTRGQVLLGSLGYLLVLSLILTLAYMLLPAMGRGILWICGFHLEKPWSIEILLTGGDPEWWISALHMLAGSLFLAGYWTFLAAVWNRWWKILLLLGGIGIALLILFASQIRWLDSGILANLEQHAADMIIWIFDEMIPAIIRFFEYIASHALMVIAAKAGAGILLSLLSYPVVRGMKVIK